MDSIKNSANFELCFIYFYEKYAWFTYGAILNYVIVLHTY